ncbi:MAG: transcriptional regulator [Candidatus Nomurabacteria bacterium]|jgi:DNA-binding HxlR family transcriptional regulator|nr:transcriptional regulator [Candidatus Nomurabacteria bacterium]
MKSRQPSSTTIPCSAALKVIGDYWTISIVQAMGVHKRRFCELERLLPDSNPVTLTSRLKKMESLGLLTRTKSPKDKISVIYTLTRQGKALLPIVIRIEKFAEGLHA